MGRWVDRARHIRAKAYITHNHDTILKSVAAMVWILGVSHGATDTALILEYR